jgi:hypothetical protein
MVEELATSEHSRVVAGSLDRADDPSDTYRLTVVM